MSKENFIGEKIKHIELGTGTIVDYIEGLYIIEFDNGGKGKFRFPNIFLTHLVPKSNAIVEYVTKTYGNNHCERCGVSIIDKNKRICDNCEKTKVRCEICGEEHYSPNIIEQIGGDVLVCDNCYYTYCEGTEGDDGYELPIPYEKLISNGFSEMDYYYYINLCDELRALMIIYNLNQNHRSNNPQQYQEENKLIKYNCNFISQAIRELFLRSFNLDCADDKIIDKGWFYFVNYNNSPFYKETIKYDDNLDKSSKQLYISLEHVRCLIEMNLYRLCRSTKQKWSFNSFDATEPMMTSELNYYKVPKRLLERKYNEISSKEMMHDKPNISFNPNNIDSVRKYIEEMNDYYEEENELNNKENELYTFLHPEYKDRLQNFDSVSAPDFDVAQDTLYIHIGNNIRCKRNNHNIICVNAKVPTMHNDKVTINVNYCTDCTKFFISDALYKSKINDYAVIYVHFEYVSANGEFFEFGENTKNEKSPLMLCGYSVSKSTGYSKIERQNILSNILERRILPKWRVLDYLTYFIEYNGLKDNLNLAVSKWKEDREFVESYDSDNQLNVEINKISRY